MRSVTTTRIRRIGAGLLLLGAVGLILSMGVVIGGLAAGYRPVVIQTGSMGETAPPGALVIARPVSADQVAVGDVLVMRPAGGPTVTHRVIEIETAGTARFAVTQGDANEAPDAAPFPLQGDQLVGRWYADDWGRRMQLALTPSYALALVGLAIALVAVGQIRRIWRPPTPLPTEQVAAPDAAVSKSLDARSRRRRRLAWSALPLTAVMTVGTAFALFRGSDDVAANVFGTRECFDPQLGSVQRGEQIHAVDGTMTVPITAVDPTESFVLASVRSDDGDPTDSTVEVRLAGGGTAVELIRDAVGAPVSPVVVSWSVVTYTCGISVQRGTATGDGDPRIDVALTNAPPERSFAIVTSGGADGHSSFGSEDLLTATVESPTALSIVAGANLPPTRTVSWQVVTFDDPGDIAVQTVTGTLSATTTTLSLPTPVDERTTFLLASATTAGNGADIGARAIRAHLSSPTTIEIVRLVGGETLQVSVQVVTLRDGSTVRHGTVDLAANEATASVAMDPVDPTRSVALSTVAVPGPSAGGSTDMVADDVMGEASATFEVTDPRTVTLTRDARTAAASFGWQVIEWAGPSWWNPDYPFRQRIDVDTDTAAAPGGYTVPVTIDHAALIANGLSLPDGDDLRILRWDGSSWTELDRILDDGSAFGTSTTTLLFRTDDPIDAASTASYWLYFGDETPLLPREDPEAVFALVEDFDTGTLGDFEDRTAGTAWYEADPWTYRRTLTVPASSVSGDLSDLPLLVQLTDPALAAAAQPDGSDIRFTAGDGSTLLPYQIERWNPVGGELTAWVRVPSIAAASANQFYLYAGAPNAPDAQAPRTVWSDADAVWHLADDPQGSAPLADDDGPRNADGTPRGSMTTADQVPGVIGSGLRLDGVDDHVEVPAVPIGAAGGFTVSAWLRADAFAGDAAMLDAGSGATSTVSLWLEPVSATVAMVRATIDVDGVAVEATGDMVAAGAWHHVAASWDGAELIVWVDGVAGTPAPAVGSLGQSTEPMRIGDRGVGRTAAPFDGTLDEVRIVQRAEPAPWFGAQVAQATDAGFVVEGPPETGVWLTQGTWSHRKPITIDGTRVSGSPDPLAVLVSVTDAELAARARVDGADIVFTADDGVTRLDHVVESWDRATGELAAWVLVPGLAAGNDTAAFVYYGNGAARDQQDPFGVFGDDADLVVLPR